MKAVVVLLVYVISMVSASAGGLYLYADGVTLSHDTAPVADGVYGVRLGTFDGNTFTPLLGGAYNALNTGYLDTSAGEMGAAFTQSDNDVLPLSSQYYIAISLIGEEDDFDGSAPMAVLTDSTWLAPAFSLINFDSYSLTSQTTAVVGGFNYNGGAPMITVTAVPEPATVAVLLGIAVVGICGLRRRRRATT